MIDIPKTLLNKVKSGESVELLETYLLNNYPIPQIIKSFAELIVITDDVNKQQILITEDEFETIKSLFRIKGQRMVDGEIIKETRGRKKITK